MAWAIKLRRKGEKRFDFLTPTGGRNGLRVHASRYEEKDKAETTMAVLKRDNPGYDFRLQEV